MNVWHFPSINNSVQSTPVIYCRWFNFTKIHTVSLGVLHPKNTWLHTRHLNGAPSKLMQRRQKRVNIRPQCLFSSVVSTYRYNTVSFFFVRLEKKVTITVIHAHRMPVESFTPLLRVHTPVTCSAWASTFPNGRHFDGLKHLWIYIYIYLYIFLYANKQIGLIRSVLR